MYLVAMLSVKELVVTIDSSSEGVISVVVRGWLWWLSSCRQLRLYA